MGPITRELLQKGLLDYFTLMVIFEPDKQKDLGADKQPGNGHEERGIAPIEPKDITAVFRLDEYMRLYQANTEVLASMLKSPWSEMRELAYAFDRVHWKVKLEYARLEKNSPGQPGI